MEERKYCVYMHTTPSNKVYIGITCRNPHNRWSNGYGYRSQSYFYKAITKYGWDNIHHIIIQNNLTQKEAVNLERNLISTFDSTNPLKGYNISHGGDISSARLGVRHTEETKNKISKCLKGRKMSEEAIKKMSMSRSGSGNWAYGKHFSDAHRKHLSEAHIGKMPSNARQIMCIETGEIFCSMASATRTKSINNICKVIDDPNHTAGGYHWVSCKNEVKRYD